MDKKSLTETDIRTKFITPAITGPDGMKWDVMTQIREEVFFTKGRVLVRGKTVKRGVAKKADYILVYRPNLPLGVVEAKDNNHSVGAGMQQALEYAEILDIPYAYSSNGDSFLEHDRTATSGNVTREIPLDQFPSAEELWNRYRAAKGFTDDQEWVVVQDYYDDGSGKLPRYYQIIAINRTVEAIARGEDRILLVMATGTGKTYTAFQIIWRLWKSGAKKRILFLVDRNILADQTKTNDFKPFGKAMTKITNRTVDKSFEIYLCLYQAVTGTDEDQNIYKQFSSDFFDLIIVDECHRGSAADDAAWRKVLDYFSSATQIGLTATPKETKEVSNIEYFGEPIYTYSLKQGISDGFLAPYKVVRIGLDKDLDGWRPEDGQKDKHGQLIEDREYNVRDFDRNLILEKRTAVVAAKITEFLKATDRFSKTIVFCENIEHAERMRQALVNANADLAAANPRYIMRITGDNDEGKAQLDNFIDPESTYPVIAVTSRLMSTGVDAQTCKLIVLDRRIASMTEFKQIIGRGTGRPPPSSPIRTSTAIPSRFTNPALKILPSHPMIPLKVAKKILPAATSLAILHSARVKHPASRPRNTTSTTSRCASSPSASNTLTPTASSSPSPSRTTPAKLFSRPTPRWRISSPSGTTPTGNRPSLKNSRKRVSSSTSSPTRLAEISTPSTSSAMSPSINPRSPARNGWTRSGNATSSPNTATRSAPSSKHCSRNTPTRASPASSRWTF
jgi:type I restriction enzyme R subunit